MFDPRLVTVAVTLSLAACGPDYVSPSARIADGDSLALQVAKSADIVGLKDAQVPAERSIDGAALLQSRDLVNSAYSASSSLISLTSGAMALLTSIASGPDVDKRRYVAIVGWMPKDEAADAEAARLRWSAIVMQAISESAREQAFPGLEVSFPPPSRSTLYLNSFGASIQVDEFRMELRGGRCAERRKQFCDYRVAMGTAPELGRAPPFLPSGEVWEFDTHHGMVGLPRTIQLDDFRRTWAAGVDDLSWFVHLTKLLPSWAYVYVGPQGAGYRNPESNALKLLPFPVVINGGRIHYFAVPAAAP
jgi:hypothetical protein